MCNAGRNRERTREDFLKRARHGKINRKFRRIETIMKKMTLVATLFVIATLIAPAAFAQSSGSFNFASLPLQCVVNNSSGALTGGVGGTVTSLKTTMKTSSGNGNVFVINPSAVVGLLTNVTISSKQTTASTSAQAGVDFQVTVTPLSGQADPVVIPSTPITYEDRFIKLSSNLFTAIATQCLANTDGSGGCYISFDESTLGAHSFNWIVTNLQSGNYGVTVQWTPSTLVSDGTYAAAATCVGPVNIIVTQNKIFTPSTGIAF